MELIFGAVYLMCEELAYGMIVSALKTIDTSVRAELLPAVSEQNGKYHLYWPDIKYRGQNDPMWKEWTKVLSVIGSLHDYTSRLSMTEGYGYKCVFLLKDDSVDNRIRAHGSENIHGSEVFKDFHVTVGVSIDHLENHVELEF